MAVIMRQASDDFRALQVMSALDKHGIRVVSVVVNPAATFGRYVVCGQAEHIDYDAVDATIDRIREGEEEV